MRSDNLPKLDDDLKHEVKKRRMKRIIPCALILIFDILVYRYYFIVRENSYSPGQHVGFWLLFLLFPWFCIGIYKLITVRSYTGVIKGIGSHDEYCLNGPSFIGRERLKKRTMLDFRILRDDGRYINYSVNATTSHNIVLRNGFRCARIAGLKYVFCTEGPVDGYYICSVCGYLSREEQNTCERCRKSIIRNKQYIDNDY